MEPLIASAATVEVSPLLITHHSLMTSNSIGQDIAYCGNSSDGLVPKRNNPSQSIESIRSQVSHTHSVILVYTD